MTPKEDVPWDDTTTMMVMRSEPEVGRDRLGRLFFLAYDVNDRNPDGAVCNLIRGDGVVCRLPNGHFDEHGLGHMPFSPLLLIESGVYVTDIAVDYVP